MKDSNESHSSIDMACVILPLASNFVLEATVCGYLSNISDLKKRSYRSLEATSSTIETGESPSERLVQVHW